jgi:hypothetical protein
LPFAAPEVAVMPRSNVARFLKVAALSTLSLALAFTAFMGFAHTRAGRPLLALMGHGGHGATKGGCPLGFDKGATPQQRAAARARFAADHHGEGRAAARPALGFRLDETTRADVTAWAESHGVTCRKPRSGADLDCADLSEALLPDAARGAGVQNLWLTFGAADTLVSVMAVRRDASAGVISDTFRAVTGELAHDAGPAAAVEGDPSPARLSSGLLQQASAEYRFRDYYALARATNMGNGFVLTEEYRSLAD